MTRPAVARIYDYWLGGKDNFATDREAAENILAIVPEAQLAARENREFLGRSVRFLADAGIRQFIDLGTGLPTQGHVHDIVDKVVPDAKVVYVDNDPIVRVHAQALLHSVQSATIVEADVRESEKILEHPEVRSQIDFDEPVAVLMVAILHFITPEEDPYRIVSLFREAMAPGSHLVVSHVTADPRPQAEAPVLEVYSRASAPMVPRGRDQVERFFDGFDLVEPGVVYAPRWRPDAPDAVHAGADAEVSFMLAGVGRKR